MSAARHGLARSVDSVANGMNNNKKATVDQKSWLPVRYYRERAGLTRMALARKTGLDYSRLSLIESEAVKPSREAAQAIADGIGEPIEVIFPEWDKLKLAKSGAFAKHPEGGAK